MMRACSLGAMGLAASLSAAVGAVQTSQPAASRVVAVRAARGVDVVTGQVLSRPVAIVEDDLIARFGSDVNVPPGATTIDLGDLTLLPGLIDAHTHVFLLPGHDAVRTNIEESIPFRTIKATVAARMWLERGFTTIRDVDTEGAGYGDVAVRDAIDQGIVIGPRMQVATRAISITGAYMDQVGLAPGIEVPTPAAIVKSPDEIRQQVREQIKYGADVVKLYSTSTIRDIDPRTMTPMTLFGAEEHRIVVEEARRYRRYVAAHCYGGDGATYAIDAGVRSIDHGMLLTPEHLRSMAARGVYWVPTLSTYVKGAESGQPPVDLRRRVVEAHKRTFRHALGAGVKIAMGSDVSDGTAAHEFELMVAYGMTPLDALRAGTVVAAEMMGWRERVGSLEAGKLADMIALAGNPLDDIRAVHQVRFVMKGGRIVHDARGDIPRRPSP